MNRTHRYLALKRYFTSAEGTTPSHVSYGNRILCNQSRRIHFCNNHRSSPIALELSQLSPPMGGGGYMRVAFHTTPKTYKDGSISTSTSMDPVKYLNNLSPREEAILEQNILSAISDKDHGIIDPILKTDVRTLGWLQSIQFKRPSMSKSSGILFDVIADDDDSKLNFSSSNETKKNEDEYLIAINLNMPTLMHPGIDGIKENIISLVTNEVISFMQEKGIIHQDSNVKADAFNIDVRMKPSQPTPFIRSMKMNTNTKEQDELIEKLGPGLKNVRHFLAVYSCKGGVGKSTIAVNLAYELARLGGRVGLLDLDVYGPSLPVLIQPDDPEVRRSTLGPGVVQPINHRGVQMLSLGFVSPTSGVPGAGPGGGAAVMRGPMAGRVVTQLLKGTEWGDLDVLILDMPPGTGDVQLTVCQDLELSGAVSVTTPSKLAATDAAKGIDMFTSLGVPTLALVENMSYFDCEGGQRHFPFGKSIKEASKMLKHADSHLTESNIFQIPISIKTNEANDNSNPLCLSRPVVASVELDIFHQISSTIAKELLLLQYGKSSDVSDDSSIRIGGEVFDVASLQLSVDNNKNAFIVRFFSDAGATQMEIPGKTLRSWHPKLGEPMETKAENEANTEKSIEESDGMVTHTSHKGCGSNSQNQDDRNQRLFPCKIEKKGRYGYSIEWADKATIIYSMYSLARAAGGVPHQ